jgi:hypothetical protein
VGGVSLKYAQPRMKALTMTEVIGVAAVAGHEPHRVVWGNELWMFARKVYLPICRIEYLINRTPLILTFYCGPECRDGFLELVQRDRKT